MQKKIILIHGFNVRDGGEGSIGKLRPLLESKGYRVELFSYGFLGLLMVRLRTNFIARMLHVITEPDDIIIAHSHGCAITAKALEMSDDFYKCVFIHPALDNKWEIPEGCTVQKITVFYSEKDMATWAAKLLKTLSPLRLFGKKHFWGGMGSTGAVSNDPRFENINDGHSHSGIFKDLEKWGPRILKSIE